MLSTGGRREASSHGFRHINCVLFLQRLCRGKQFVFSALLYRLLYVSVNWIQHEDCHTVFIGLPTPFFFKYRNWPCKCSLWNFLNKSIYCHQNCLKETIIPWYFRVIEEPLMPSKNPYSKILLEFMILVFGGLGVFVCLFSPLCWHGRFSLLQLFSDIICLFIKL